MGKRERNDDQRVAHKEKQHERRTAERQAFDELRSLLHMDPRSPKLQVVQTTLSQLSKLGMCERILTDADRDPELLRILQEIMRELMFQNNAAHLGTYLNDPDVSSLTTVQTNIFHWDPNPDHYEIDAGFLFRAGCVGFVATTIPAVQTQTFLEMNAAGKEICGIGKDVEIVGQVASSTLDERSQRKVVEDFLLLSGGFVESVSSIFCLPRSHVDPDGNAECVLFRNTSFLLKTHSGEVCGVAAWIVPCYPKTLFGE